MPGKSRRKRFKRESLDWVVNDQTYGFQATVPNTALLALPLTWPQVQVNITTFSGVVPVGGYAYPEPNERLRVKAVVGSFFLLPSIWAAGSTFRWAARIVQKPMDFATGAAIADSLYSLDNAEYANERFNWEKHQFQAFSQGGSPETHYVRAKMNQLIEPDSALWFIFENVSGITQTLTLGLHLRTLVAT